MSYHRRYYNAVGYGYENDTEIKISGEMWESAPVTAHESSNPQPSDGDLVETSLEVEVDGEYMNEDEARCAFPRAFDQAIRNMSEV